MNIGIVIRSAASVTPTWTTPALAVAAQRAGHDVWIAEVGDFQVDPRGVRVRCFRFPARIDATVTDLVDGLTRRTAPRALVDPRTFGILLLRSSPLEPALLSFAMLVRDLGVEVVNDPLGLTQVSHKAWLAAQPGVRTPRTLVTRSRASAHLFHADIGRVVVKPDRSSGGHAVGLVLPGDREAFDEAFDDARGRSGWVVVQAYLDRAAEGEKRLVWLDGAIIGGYLRTRAPGEFRHNLKQGATPGPTAIEEEDRSAVAALDAPLRRLGIRVAGIDCIGGQVVEVNAVNPGGTHYADALHGTHLAERIVATLTDRTAHGERPLETEEWAPPVP